MNIVLDRPAMKTLHGLHVIRSSHHNDVFVFSPRTWDRHKSSYEDLYVLTKSNIICNMMVIQTLVGYKMNHAKGN